MKYDVLIPVAIVTTVAVGILNVFFHFMPYSAPPVLLMLTIAALEVTEALSKR